MDTAEYGTIAERVARGLAWIQADGATRYRIDLTRVPTDERLLIQDPCGCVIGWGRDRSDTPPENGWVALRWELLSEESGETLAPWLVPGDDTATFDSWAYAHGFTAYVLSWGMKPALGSPGHVEPLETEWRRVLGALDLYEATVS